MSCRHFAVGTVPLFLRIMHCAPSFKNYAFSSYSKTIIQYPCYPITKFHKNIIEFSTEQLANVHFLAGVIYNSLRLCTV